MFEKAGVIIGGVGSAGDYEPLRVDIDGCVFLSDKDVNRIAERVVELLNIAVVHGPAQEEVPYA